jgi:hypothetical protein
MDINEEMRQKVLEAELDVLEELRDLLHGLGLLVTDVHEILDRVDRDQDAGGLLPDLRRALNTFTDLFVDFRAIVRHELNGIQRTTPS